MRRSACESWGRWLPSTPATVLDARAGFPRNGLLLAYGRGRSYGDVCLNNGEVLLDTAALDRIHEFDEELGVVRCEAGVTLDSLIQHVLPRGWFLAVTPGTRYLTVGGCVANDVHGKNHHRQGTFGNSIRSVEILRSDGSRVTCSPEKNAELFAATVGGLGLTGLILSVELQLRRIVSSEIVARQQSFRSLGEFAALSREAELSDEYSVAWFDSLAGRDVRGIFYRGNHAESGSLRLSTRSARRLPVAPFAPFFGPMAVRAFNTLFFAANERPEPARVAYDRFFYPLDAVANWNAIYGRRGFLQYQFVVPAEAGLEPVARILRLSAESRLASFLTVIKRFGRIESPGLLSFSREGTTVCLDFAARHGAVLLRMLESFDAIVLEANGALYPAKDARMSGEMFRRSFPRWEEFAMHVDPRFSSSFWRRVTA